MSDESFRLQVLDPDVKDTLFVMIMVNMGCEVCAAGLSSSLASVGCSASNPLPALSLHNVSA
jgi:hypothetical protein